MLIETNPDMIKAVKRLLVSPGNRITDASDETYIKMEAAGLALRVRDGKVFMLGCLSYPIQVEHND